MKFYHGGMQGLTVGETVVPRQNHPMWRGLPIEYNGRAAGSFGDNGTTVSLTIDLEIARAHAGEYLHYDNTRKPGQVYEVTLLRKPYADLDFATSFPEIARCKQGAEIVAVLDVVAVEENPRVKTKALAKHMLMKGGSPVYDANGYIKCTPSTCDERVYPTRSQESWAVDALRPDRPGRAHESDRNICPLVSPATTSELCLRAGVLPRPL